jgi:ribosomal protein L11 methylase PrmA
LTRSSILDLGSAKARLSMCALDLDNYKLTIPDNDVHQVRRAALNLSFRAQIVFVLEKSYKDRTEVDESGAIGVRVYGEY